MERRRDAWLRACSCPAAPPQGLLGASMLVGRGPRGIDVRGHLGAVALRRARLVLVARRSILHLRLDRVGRDAGRVLEPQVPAEDACPGQGYQSADAEHAWQRLLGW